MKILIYDVETAPKLAYVWGLWDQNISLPMLAEDGYMLMWSAKWLGEDEIFSDNLANHRNQTRFEHVMVKKLTALMDEADIIVTYNGNRFDTPIFNTVLLRAGKVRPLPSKSIDLLQVVRRNFKFTSNKLDYVAQRLGIGNKTKHEGFGLWEKVMRGDKDAVARMSEYNDQDVLLTEALYLKVRGWIKNHPNVNIGDNSEEVRCSVCGSGNLVKCGTEYLAAGAYQRYRCKSCGAPNRGVTIKNSIDKRRSLTRSL